MFFYGALKLVFIELRADVADSTSRITAVEIELGRVVAAKQSHHRVIIARLDRMEGRIGRLERHAGMLPA